jgi:hypothetical protein
MKDEDIHRESYVESVIIYLQKDPFIPLKFENFRKFIGYSHLLKS